MNTWHHYIDGHSVAPDTGTYLNAFDPCTGKPCVADAAGDAHDIGLAVQASLASAAAWRSLHRYTHLKYVTIKL